MITTKERGEVSLALVAAAGLAAASVSLATVSYWWRSQPGYRVHYLDDEYLVSVRSPWEQHEIREFIQPDNPGVSTLYLQIGPDVGACLDWVCQNISYREDPWEYWSFPAETIKRGTGDCEDSAFLTCSLLRNFTNAHAVLGALHGYGHSWCQANGEILETTYTSYRPVPNPEDYKPYVFFNDQEVIELWPGALEDIFSLRQNEGTKLNLMAQAIGDEVPPECPSLWPPLVVGTVMGGILGTGFAMILRKGE
ncbi:hypothetical protein ES707_06354 [subsurface metagenome]